MKTIKNLLSIFVLITSLTFVSCENEPLDQSLLNNTNSGGGIIDGGVPNNGNFKVKIDGEWFTPANIAGIKVMPNSVNLQPFPSYTIMGASDSGKFVSIQFYYTTTFNLITGFSTTSNNIATIAYSPNGNLPDDQMQLYVSVNAADPFSTTGSVNLNNNATQQLLNGTFQTTVYLLDDNGNVIGSKSLTEGTLTNFPYTIE